MGGKQTRTAHAPRHRARIHSREERLWRARGEEGSRRGGLRAGLPRYPLLLGRVVKCSCEEQELL